jgi:DNA-binding SARP family transcriptional activator/pimeloyl-ACP methyl ester carboxylesterase
MSWHLRSDVVGGTGQPGLGGRRPRPVPCGRRQDQRLVMTRLEVRLLGFPSLRLDGRSVDLALRKGLGLIAYLADVQAPVARDHMACLLWPEADAEVARGRLRRTLHKIGAAFAAEVIDADRTSLTLAPLKGLRVDTHAFEAACAAGRLSEALQLYTGDFLHGLSIGECEAFEEWAFFRREALRSQLVQALERLSERELEGGDARAAVAAATRLVGLDPLNERAQRHLIGACLKAGDRAAAERQYEACRHLLEVELGIAPDARTRALMQSPGAEATLSGPRTRYAERHGLHIAYQVVGAGPMDIVMVPGFVSHVERIWDEPRCRGLLTALSQMGRLVLFDRRGVGLSDRVGAPPTVEATAEDLATAMDAAGCRRVLLIGASEGGPGCIHFAAKHPERLAGLVLYGSLAKGTWSADYPYVLTHEQYDLWLRRLIRDWGGPAEIATFAPSLVGDGQAERWWAGLLRAASSPGAIKAVLESLRDTDVRSLLPRITVPTLVLHRRGDRAVRIDAGRHLARAIPGASMIELDGADHWLWAGDYRSVLAQIRAFLSSIEVA